ncbi:uncharacterized protein LOC134840128 [Symsagittifera roscoffensis]|uniref:uncharacterized protein LOC134840128 n=1 Tax=Symsagittifera roscoffensis TaxID=84072 RepID=UPI00307C760F
MERAVSNGSGGDGHQGRSSVALSDNEQHNDTSSVASSSCSNATETSSRRGRGATAEGIRKGGRGSSSSTASTRYGSTCSFNSTKCINIVLLGKAGVGKSSFGNFIFSTHTFPTTPTHHCQLNELQSGEVTVRVLDTPGLLGIGTDSVSVLKSVGSEVMRHLGFIHAFVLVLRCDTSMSREDIDCFNVYKSFFGEVFKRHCIVAFSRSDNLKRDLAKYGLSSEDYFRLAPQRLRNLLEEVGSRYLFFGSEGDLSGEYGRERESLLEFVEQMSRQPYKREFLYQQKQLFLNEMKRKETEWRDGVKKKAADKRAEENKRELQLRDEMMRRVAHAALREREISTKVYRDVESEQARIHDTDACSLM